MQVSRSPTSLDVNSNLTQKYRAKNEVIKAIGSKLGSHNRDFPAHQKPVLVSYGVQDRVLAEEKETWPQSCGGSVSSEAVKWLSCRFFL